MTLMLESMKVLFQLDFQNVFGDLRFEGSDLVQLIIYCAAKFRRMISIGRFCPVIPWIHCRDCHYSD